MWFGRVDAPPFSRPPLPPPPLPKPLFVGSSAHLQRRGWRGWFYWSRLTTPSTPSHHAYAPPLLPRRAREHAGASAGARHRRPPSHRPYKAITKLGVARWLIELDKSWRHRFSSLEVNIAAMVEQSSVYLYRFIIMGRRVGKEGLNVWAWNSSSFAAEGDKDKKIFG